MNVCSQAAVSETVFFGSAQAAVSETVSSEAPTNTISGTESASPFVGRCPDATKQSAGINTSAARSAAALCPALLALKLECGVHPCHGSSVYRSPLLLQSILWIVGSY